jgi:hypothetical protein
VKRLSIFIRMTNAKGFSMSHNPDDLELTLAHKALFSLSDAAGVTIECLQGSLWLTLDDDPKDVILDAGERFVTTDHRRALIYALEAASLRLSREASAAPALTVESTRLSLRLPAALLRGGAAAAPSAA